jgi:hypothetical protein
VFGGRAAPSNPDADGAPGVADDDVADNDALGADPPEPDPLEQPASASVTQAASVAASAGERPTAAAWRACRMALYFLKLMNSDRGLGV